MSRWKRAVPTVVVLAAAVVASVPGPVAATPFKTALNRGAQVVTGIASDCSRDVTAELNDWFARLPNGATATLAHNGCYRVDGTLRVVGKWDLTVRGNGATIRAVTDGDRGRRHISFVDGGRLTVRDLVVRGANPHAGTGGSAYREDREAQHAFELRGVHGAVLERLQAYDVYGDFVYVGMGSGNGRASSGGFRERWSRDVVVQDSHFARNGRQGIAITAGQDVTVRRNTIKDVRRAMFDLEPNGPTWGARRILIEGNTTGRGRLLWLAAHGHAGDVGDVTVRGNVMEDLSGVPVISVQTPRSAPALRGPFTVTGNRFRVAGSPAPGFRFTRVQDVLFADNTATFPEKRKMTALSFVESQRIVVARNSFAGAAREQ